MLTIVVQDPKGSSLMAKGSRNYSLKFIFEGIKLSLSLQKYLFEVIIQAEKIVSSTYDMIN
jgi:hypothetical protein